ncbi:hypothetical protein DUI87_19194 [Hirundo rustica rustica]|uniref:Reverse transcriptase domain-containing protein n=1 Tax=Hirundo rustica rustica TaxID=333673 RepID=A0A3M0JTK5_HIRRU|nr:hypothetical protein DUI87_19194 [Hirundo rustica rustica]
MTDQNLPSQCQLSTMLSPHSDINGGFFPRVVTTHQPYANVVQALSGVRKQFRDTQFYHYMDDILVAASTQDKLLRVQPQLINALHSHGLQGDSDLKSPHTLTPEARQVLEEVQRAVSACQVYRIDPSADVTVFITTPDLHPTGIIGQWNEKWSDFLHVLEWVFLPHQLQKTSTALFDLIARLIIKCRQQCLQLMGVDPAKIVLPVQQEDFDWSFANSISLQSALENFSEQIAYHLPSHKLLHMAKFTEISLRPKWPWTMTRDWRTSWVSILDQYPYFFNKSFWRASQETALSGRGASGFQDPCGRPPGIFWEEGSCGPADHPGKDQNLLELWTKGVEELLVHRMYRGLWEFV